MNMPGAVNTEQFLGFILSFCILWKKINDKIPQDVNFELKVCIKQQKCVATFHS